MTENASVELQSSLFSLLGEGGFEVMFELINQAPALYQTCESLGLSLFSDLVDAEFGVTAASAASKKSSVVASAAASKDLDLLSLQAIGSIVAEEQARADLSRSLPGVSRTSDKQQLKLLKAQKKAAAQALAAASSADGGDLDYLQTAGFDPAYLEQERRLGLQGGGFRGASDADIAAMRAALLPEGTREYHEKGALPSGATREYGEGFEKVVIPAKYRDESKLPPRVVLKDRMDAQCLKGFHNIATLNPMQSITFEAAFNSQENLLICAPTGAGKTNVAMLAVLAHFRDCGVIKSDSAFPSSDYSSSLFSSETDKIGKKVIYIAPMKALAQEVVEKFSERLKPLRLVVRELTGDMQLSRAEADAADVIVTTPEKWDVVTRKGGDGSLSTSCGLLIIDEVHLLADDRGAVIESVVARLHRLVESSQRRVRIVGLSATLPNYKDVAAFLRVKESRGLFFFGPEHRPVPLSQTFIGVTEKDRWKNIQRTNELCYDVVADSLRRGYQVMVFVHSRKDAGQTAKVLADIAAKRGELEQYFLTSNDPSSAFSKYVQSAEKSRNRELAEHFRNGMGIHHAGMLRHDRKLSESMFADGAIKVLCCTATLAWGINLPAHTVVIKGTEIYNPEKGGIVDLSILDVMQIFGRAGRPQYDSFGEATMITSHKSLARYLSLLVEAVPIESNFMKQLPDHLNAEVVGGTVSNINEAASWLMYTYLYVRMLRNPIAYGIPYDRKDEDPSLKVACRERVADAAKLLDQRRMIRYDPGSGNLAVTHLGRVASHFYIQNESVATFNELLARYPAPTDGELLHIICCACEFSNVKVRSEELKEVDSLHKSKLSCPLEVIAAVEDSPGKSNVLLQAYISNSRVESFTLISDTNYIASNAGRVARALFEMCLTRGMADAALKLLRIAKSVDKKCWWFHSPLRQFAADLPSNIFPCLEARKYASYDMTLRLLDMKPDEVGQLAHWAKGGSTIQQHVRYLPTIELDCVVQPVTRGILKFNLTLRSTFTWSGKWLGGATGFWLWVEDGQNERIYHHEYILLQKRTHPHVQQLELTIPAFEPLPPQYYVRVVSDQCVGCETLLPVSFQHLLLPDRHTAYTNLADLTPLPTSALRNEAFETLYANFGCFNPIQTQMFHVLYHTDTPVLLGAPTGSGKTIVSEIALLRMKRVFPKKKCVYIAPLKSLARERLKDWRTKLGDNLGWVVIELSGDTSYDAKAMSSADVLICTPEKWDMITRGWRDESRSFIEDVGLLIIDEIHLLGEERGAVLEAIVTRTRFISDWSASKGKQAAAVAKGDSGPGVSAEATSFATRVVGLSTALANPRDLAEWMGVDFDRGRGIGMYNFRPSVRPIPMEVHIQGFPGRHYCPRMATMNKPCYAAIKEHSPTKPVLIFVASRRQTRLTALDLISYAAGDENPRVFLHCDDVDPICETITDDSLKHTLSFGIGLHHAGLSSSDRETVEKMFLNGQIQVLVATATLAWGVNLPAHLVIVKGTEFFDGKTSTYVDYPVTDVLQMIGRAGRPQFDKQGIACVLVAEGKKNFYRKFLYEPFPVESCLENKLCECLNAEIATKSVTDKEEAMGFLKWTYYWKRLKQNPSYYGCPSASDADLDAFIGEVVEKTLSSLTDTGCIAGVAEDGTIMPTVLGEACSKYYLVHVTPKEMRDGIRNVREFVRAASENKERRKFTLDERATAMILEVMAYCSEFDELPVRHNEENLNEELAADVKWGVGEHMDFIDPHCKCFLLLQAWMGKTKLPISDYINDTKSVVDQVGRLLAAMTHVSLGEGEGEANYMLDVMTAIVGAKQCMNARCYPGPEDAIVGQLDGVKSEKVWDEVLATLNSGVGGDGGVVADGSLKTLAVMRAQCASPAGREQLLKLIQRTSGVKAGSLLDSLERLPLVTVSGLHAGPRVGGGGERRSGVLSFNLGVEFGRAAAASAREERQSAVADDGAKGGQHSVVIVVATPDTRAVVVYETVKLRNAKSNFSKSVELEFDWEKTEGGGGSGGRDHLIVTVMCDWCRGVDLICTVKLSK